MDQEFNFDGGARKGNGGANAPLAPLAMPMRVLSLVLCVSIAWPHTCDAISLELHVGTRARV